MDGHPDTPDATVDDASSTVVVFTGGDRPSARGGALVLPDGFVIAADSGLEHAMALGHRVDMVVGDMDSVDPVVLAAARDAGAVVKSHSVVKDETDLEIAMGEAASMGARRVVVVGGWGDRADHVLANVMLFGAQRYAAMSIEAHMAGGRLFVVRDHLDIVGERGDLVSLLALHGDVSGVHTGGLAYPLDDEVLAMATTRGVSNEMTGSLATVDVGAGVLSVFAPGRPGAHVLSGLIGDTGHDRGEGAR